MSDSWNQPWSNSSTAPQIVKYDYVAEKALLTGSFVGTALYGLLTLLFFQCMVALLNPPHRRDEGIKLWPIFYTVAMFSLVTVYTVMSLHIQSISFIDNRRDDGGYSGVIGYQAIIRRTPLGIVPNIMFNLNNWLADGLLIFRCYIIYSTNLWAIALPCLMYLASLGMGIATLYFQHIEIYALPGLPKFSVPYLLISVSLNILLTLMIVIRLVLHGRNIRTATGSLVGISGLYKTISTVLIESCALFSMNSLLVVGAMVPIAYSTAVDPSVIGGFVVDIFFPILAEIQVIAPLLIIQRVADGSAVTSHTITTEHTTAGYGKNPSDPGVAV